MRPRINGRGFVCLLIAALAFGCRTENPGPRIAEGTSPARIKMSNFVGYFANRVERAADDIAQQEGDPSVDRSTVYWKLRAIPLAQAALQRADDQAAVMQLWVISASMAEAIAGDHGKSFGSGQPVALAAAKEIEEQARELAASLLTPEQFEQSEPVVAEYARSRASSSDPEHAPPDDAHWGRMMSSILKKPINVLQAPFSSLDLTSGLSDTALAMHRFTDEFSRARTELEYLPREVRWNTQLLLMELNETLDLPSVATGVSELGSSASSLAETARTLPEELRAELTAFSDSLAENRTELEGALREANATLENTRETARSLDAMSATMTETFHAFTGIVESFERDPDAPPKPPEEKGPPFDINDYGRTAEKLTETAAALTALLDAVEEQASATEPPPLLVTMEATLSSIVNRLLLGAGALIVFAAAVAYGYRVAVGRRLG